MCTAVKPYTDNKPGAWNKNLSDQLLKGMPVNQNPLSQSPTSGAPTVDQAIPGEDAPVRRVSRGNRMSIRSGGSGLSVPL